MAGRPVLRVGLLLDGLQVCRWQAECIEKIAAVENVSVDLLVVNDQSRERAQLRARLKSTLTRGLLLWRLYDRLVLRKRVRSTSLVEVPNCIAEKSKIYCCTKKVGKFNEEFSKNDLARITSYSPDVLIRFGFGILSGPILDVPRFGIWSYHHGDPERIRGAPPGFWEIYRRELVAGVVLQRITEKLDGGIILQSGYFKTLASYPRLLDKMYFGAAHFVSRALSELARDPHKFECHQPCETTAPVYRYPRNLQMLRFFMVSTARRIGNRLHSMFRHQQWSIGIIDRPVVGLLENSTVNVSKWLPEPKDGFFADPFVVRDPTNSHRLIILAEKLRWSDGRGYIVSLDPSSCRSGAIITPAIKSELHRSYPFLITSEREIWCVPECAEDRRVTLYTLDSTTRRWSPEAVLLDSFPAVDPTIFRQTGRWWLFCTNAEAGANEVLFAFYADQLHGPWRPHSLNPIKIDIRSSRPAGTPFKVGEQLFRPAQDCSKHYGAAVAINRVVDLTPDSFAEEQVGLLEPDPRGPYPAGLHTICVLEQQTVVDGARWIFVPAEFARSVTRRLNRKRTGS